MQLVNVRDFIPKSKWNAIDLGTNTDDLTIFFQAAAAAAKSAAAIVSTGNTGGVYIPNGRYHISRVGIQGVVFSGESKEGTVIRAAESGSSAHFMFDAMINVDGITPNTNGNGWIENLNLDGRLSSGISSGRSGVRTYGGGLSMRRVRVDHCHTGFALGLPIWANVSSCYAVQCNTGFYTFHNSAGDNGTSFTALDCWADSCTSYGFHISQLYYSSFINSVAQNCGSLNWFLEGDLNGNTACYSLQFIGCATEGSGVPFYFKRGRDITVINPRIIGSPTSDFITFDDCTGSIMDFSTVAHPAVGKYHIATTNSSPYSIALINSLVTYDSADEGVLLRIGSGASGTTASGHSGSSFYVGGNKVLSGRGVAITDAATAGAAPPKQSSTAW